MPFSPQTPELDRLPTDAAKLQRYLDRLARGDGELRACYEASGAGDVIHRAMPTTDRLQRSAA